MDEEKENQLNPEENEDKDERLPEANAQDEESPSDENTDEKSSGEFSSINSDLIRGHINTIILRALYERDKYGYEIMNDIERKSHGQYSLKQPTLYSALKRLETQGYIKAYWKTDEVSAGGRRKYFTLTDSGKDITEKNLAEWEYSRTIIDNLISDRPFDFNQPAPTPVDFTILRNSVSRVPIVRNEENATAEEKTGDEKNSSEGTSTEGQAPKSENLTSSTSEQTIVYTVPDPTQQPAITVITETQPERSEAQSAQPAQAEQPQQANEAPAPLQQTVVTEQVQQTPQPQQVQPQEQAQPILHEQSYQQIVQVQQEQAYQQPVQQQQAQTYQQQPVQAQPVYQQQVQPQQQPVQQQPQPAQQNTEEVEARRRAHENYLRLISEPVSPDLRREEDVNQAAQNTESENMLYLNRPESERDYKNLINGIFNRALTNGSVQTNYSDPAAVEAPATRTTRQSTQLVDRGRADGVRISLSSDYDSGTTYATQTTYDKGMTFFKSACVVFAITFIEFLLCIIFMKQLEVNWVYPTVILGLGLVQLATFGIMALQGYGKHCAKPTNSNYISRCIVITLIIILIICALSALIGINFTLASDIMKMLVIPSITALNITVFAVVFRLLVK